MVSVSMTFDDDDDIKAVSNLYTLPSEKCSVHCCWSDSSLLLSHNNAMRRASASSDTLTNVDDTILHFVRGCLPLFLSLVCCAVVLVIFGYSIPSMICLPPKQTQQQTTPTTTTNQKSYVWPWTPQTPNVFTVHTSYGNDENATREPNASVLPFHQIYDEKRKNQRIDRPAARNPDTIVVVHYDCICYIWYYDGIFTTEKRHIYT